MKKLLLVFIIIILAPLLGCTSATTTLYKNDTTYPATSPEKISIFRQKPPNVDFIELGEIRVSNRGADIESVEKRMKKEAAKLGGDAVYIINQISLSADIPADRQLIVTGIVIKYR